MKKLLFVFVLSTLLAACGKDNNTSSGGLIQQYPINTQGIMTGTTQVVLSQLKVMFQQKSFSAGVNQAYSLDVQEGSWNTTQYWNGIFSVSNLSNIKYNDYIVRSVNSTAINFDKVSSGSSTQYSSATYTEADKQNFINKVFPDTAINNQQFTLTARQTYVGNRSVIIYKIVMTKIVNGTNAQVIYEVAPDLPLFANPIFASENFNGGLYRSVTNIQE
jgi:hypothetical protein